MEQTIFFHIGMGKTGSSYVQSSLALAVDALAEKGICYPLTPAEAKRVGAGGISSGNMDLRKGVDESGILDPALASQEKVLFSQEGLHIWFSKSDKETLRIRELLPNARLEFLCYIRDPLDHAVSAYHQRVKGKGFKRGCGVYLKQYDRPFGMIKLAERIAAIGGHLTIINYSRHRDDLLGTFESWLDLPSGFLPKPKSKSVNRSLTLGELELQQIFNRHLGQRAARYISGPLCEGLPELKTEKPALSQKDLGAFLDRMSSMINQPELLALIPETERYHVGRVEDYEGQFPDPETMGDIRLSPAQLDIVARSLVAALPEAERQARGDGPKKSPKKRRAKT